MRANSLIYIELLDSDPSDPYLGFSPLRGKTLKNTQKWVTWVTLSIERSYAKNDISII